MAGPPTAQGGGGVVANVIFEIFRQEGEKFEFLSVGPLGPPRLKDYQISFESWALLEISGFVPVVAWSGADPEMGEALTNFLMKILSLLKGSVIDKNTLG